MSALRIVLLLFVAIVASSGSAVSPLEAANGTTQVVSDVMAMDEGVEAGDESKAVTPFGYKATMLQAGGKAVACWRCSSPVRFHTFIKFLGSFFTKILGVIRLDRCFLSSLVFCVHVL